MLLRILKIVIPQKKTAPVIRIVPRTGLPSINFRGAKADKRSAAVEKIQSVRLARHSLIEEPLFGQNPGGETFS